MAGPAHVYKHRSLSTPEAAVAVYLQHVQHVLAHTVRKAHSQHVCSMCVHMHAAGLSWGMPSRCHGHHANIQRQCDQYRQIAAPLDVLVMLKCPLLGLLMPL
jgi:hypothetical protein